MSDMNIHGAGRSEVIQAPNLVEEQIAAKDAALIPQEIFQQFELFRGEGVDFPFEAHFMTQRVQ